MPAQNKRDSIRLTVAGPLEARIEAVQTSPEHLHRLPAQRGKRERAAGILPEQAGAGGDQRQRRNQRRQPDDGT